MQRILFLFIPALLFAACGREKSKTAQSALQPSEALSKLFVEYYDENAQFFPFNATVNGDYRFNDRLPNDGAQAFRDSLGRFYQKFLRGAVARRANQLRHVPL